MPAFPSPPLKFRTTGFPQYGFKLAFSRSDLPLPVRVLSDRSAFARFPISLYLAARPPLCPYGPCGHVSGAYRQAVPTQRSLAHQPVMLSDRVIAYYDLICASQSRPLLYVLWLRTLPDDLLGAGIERVPNLLCLSVLFVPSPVPRRTERLLLTVPSPLALAFILFARIRHPVSPPSSVLRWTASRGCKVHLMLRPKEIASPSPTRTFTFELSPPKSPPRSVEYNYAGKSVNSRRRTYRQDRQHYGLQAKTPRSPRRTTPIANCPEGATFSGRAVPEKA
jgi:hypothetical protein